MGYYSAPGRGDYYAARGRGDLGGFLKRAAKAAVGFVTGGVPGAIAGAVGGGGTRPAASTAVQITQPSFSPLPSISVTRSTGPVISAHATPEEVRRSMGLAKRRRMNPANPKALRRAIRRQEGFRALAKRFGMKDPPTKRLRQPPKKRR